MELMLLAVGAILLTVGTLAAAAILCWLLWYAFRLVSHPELSAAAVLMILALAFLGVLPKSQFLKMTLIFAMVAAVPLWIAGRAWHRQNRPNPEGARGRGLVPAHDGSAAPAAPAASFDRYPAISACIRENRSSTRNEVHVVAARLWREGLAQRFGSPLQPPSFAARRVILRTARAALSGGGEQKPSYRRTVR